MMIVYGLKSVTALMMRIEDVIIKTIVSVEVPVATACKMFMPFRGNCFGMVTNTLVFFTLPSQSQSQRE